MHNYDKMCAQERYMHVYMMYGCLKYTVCQVQFLKQPIVHV